VIVDAVGGEVDGDVVVVQNKVYEIFLDQIALVAGADDEIIEPVMGIDAHDVPEDRHAADFDQRLGSDTGLLGKTRAKATGENYDFHPKRTPECLVRFPDHPQSRPALYRRNGRMFILAPVSDFVLVRGLRGYRNGQPRVSQAAR
jgi:hypothetical protein